MSIDVYFWAPAGIRDDKNIGYRKYYTSEGMLASEKEKMPRHQAFLAHGAQFAIEEQYFFEDPQDARWFWEEGYRYRLFLLDEDEGESAGYDRMTLWIEGALVAERDTPGAYGRIEGFEPEPLDMTTFPVDMIGPEEE
jgi:hypothetical protein